MSLKVLVVISDPLDDSLDRLAFVDEWQSIAHAFARQPIAVTLTRLFPPTIDNLHHTLRGHHSPFDILHFIGHGNVDGVSLEDEFGQEDFIEAAQLAEAVKQANIQLAVLNVCESDTPANLLSLAGVKTVIGMTDSIDDRLAVTFACEFYTALGAGQTVDQAIQRAKDILKQEDDADYIPTVFGDISLCFSSDIHAHAKARTVIQNMPNNNLSYSGSFWGRERELRTGIQLIADPSCRVIQITGIGGSGKTAFCSQLVQRSAWRFFGGVVWIGGDEFVNSWEDLVVSRSRLLLKIEDPQTENSREIVDLNDLVAVMNSRPVLLIVDDVERLPQAVKDEINLFATRLNPLVGSKMIIITQVPIVNLEEDSNVGLLQLEPLDIDSAVQVALAQAHLHGVIEIELLTEKALESLLNRIDCNPKMIQLVLGLTKAVGFEECKLTLEQISGPTPQMLDTLIGCVVNTLDESDVELLQILTLFAMPFTIDDIRAISQNAAFQHNLMRLRDRDLLRFDPFSMKYGTHNLVKDFVSINLPIRADHIHSYGALILSSITHWISLAWQKRSEEIDFETERFLLEAKTAVRRLQAIADQKAHELIIQITDALRDYLHFQRQDWKTIFYFEQAARSSCQALNNTVNLGSILTSLAAVIGQSGEHDEALKLCYEGIECLQKLEDPTALSIGYGSLGFILRKSGKLYESETAYETAYKYAQDAHSSSLEIRHLSNLGNVYRLQGDREKARQKYEQALTLARSANDLPAVAMQLDLLGLVARDKQPEEALQLHQEAYTIKAGIGDNYGLRITRNHLVATLTRLDRAKEALAYFDDVLGEIENDTDSIGNWYTLLQLARLYRSIQDADAALDYYMKAMNIAKSHRFSRGISICERGIALCYQMNGEPDAAFEHIQQAIQCSSTEDSFLPTLLEEAQKMKEMLTS